MTVDPRDPLSSIYDAVRSASDRGTKRVIVQLYYEEVTPMMGSNKIEIPDRTFTAIDVDSRFDLEDLLVVNRQVRQAIKARDEIKRVD